jgi:hypothetical protein
MFMIRSIANCMQTMKEDIYYLVATKKKVVLHVIQTSAFEIKPFARMGNGGATFQLWHN